MYLAKLPLICIFLSLSRLLKSLCVPVCLSVCVHHNSKNNGSVHLKLEHIVIYENGHMGIVLSRSSSQCDFAFFLHLPQYKLLSLLSQLWHMLVSCD